MALPMTNLEKSLKTLLIRAHRVRAHGGKRLHQESGISLMLGDIDKLDPESPILVNMAGEAKLPRKTTAATLVLDNVRDNRLRFLTLCYVAERGRIKTLRLDSHLDDDEEFWWLTVTTAINVEASR